MTNVQRIDTYNAAVRAAASQIADICDDPALCPQLLPTADIKGNDYNPNKVACPELDLLELSIREDGVTMAVVVMPSSDGDTWTVIDGFHRRKVVQERLGRDFIPCTILHKTDSERMASTVRHNRARGKHHVDLMAVLVKSMLDSGMADEDTAKHLGMTTEEFLRLLQMVGAAKILATEEYSRSWGLIESS